MPGTGSNRGRRPSLPNSSQGSARQTPASTPTSALPQRTPSKRKTEQMKTFNGAGGTTSPVTKKPHVTSKNSGPPQRTGEGQTQAKQVASDSTNPHVIKVIKTADGVLKVGDPSNKKIPMFQALVESINSVQTNMNSGLDSLRNMLTAPVVGLEPRVSALERYVPAVKALERNISNPSTGIEPRLQEVERSVKTLALTQGSGSGEGAPEALCQEVLKLDERIELLEQRSEVQESNMDLLTAWAGTMYRAHASLKKQVQFNTSKHHNTDLVVGGIYEYQKQDNRKAALKFFKERMKLAVVESDVIRAYRTGERHVIKVAGQPVTCPRQMIVKCSQKLRDLAVQNRKILGGQVDQKGGFTYFVAPYLPEAFKAAKEKYRSKVDEVYRDNADKSASSKSVARVVGTELSIDNQIQQDTVTPPDPHEVIHVLNTQAAKLEEIVFMITEKRSEQGSKFQGFAVWLTKIPTVELAYVKVRKLVPNADHIMLAYDIPDYKGSWDDGETYGDLQMVKQLQRRELSNIAVFITRIKGPNNLGSKRFEVIRDIMDDVFQLTEENPPDPVDRGWSPWDGHDDDEHIVGFPAGLDHTSASVAEQVERELQLQQSQQLLDSSSPGTETTWTEDQSQAQTEVSTALPMEEEMQT